MDVKLTDAADDTIHVVVDGKTITLKSKLKRINGVTYAPIRVVGDARVIRLAGMRKHAPLCWFPKTEVAQTGGRGFMWEVESNGNTVYLVGSMHIADDSFYPRPEFEEAFAEADYLGVEIDISKAADEEQRS